MARFREVLKNRNFLFLWLGQLISNFGDRLNQMALVALVYQRSPGNEVALAKLISFTIIPVFVIGPIAGAWVDRLDRRKVMLASDILRGFLVFLIPLFIITKQILLIYLIIFVSFSISRFFIPSKMAIIPELVPKDKLLVANSLQDTTHMIGNVIGLVVAGMIVNIRTIGAVGGFYIDSATFFASAVFLSFMSKKSLMKEMKDDIEATKEVLERSIRKSLFSEIKEGFSYLTKYSDMRFIVYVFFLLLAGIGAISCVIIVFIQNVFGSSTKHLGILGMYFVVGLFLGTLAYGRLGQNIRRRKAIQISLAATGMTVVLFTIVVSRLPNIFISGLLASLTGLTAGPIMSCTNTLAHETIPEEIRGRVFSSLEAVIHLAFLIFMFTAAYGAKFLDRSIILLLVGAVFFICGVAGFVRSRGG